MPTASGDIDVVGMPSACLAMDGGRGRRESNRKWSAYTTQCHGSECCAHRAARAAHVARGSPRLRGARVHDEA